MESSVPGFVNQSTGKLTRKRFKYATVFVDHFSRLSYVHLHKTTNAADALEAKSAFEQFARVHGVHVRHYHADNGIFNSEAFKKAVSSSQQSLAFCGIGAHRQSGIAEHQICDLTELARAQLLHAMNHNCKTVLPHLWPFALRHAAYMYNILPRSSKTLSLIELFSGTKNARPNLEHVHPFGCPVYVFDECLQTGKIPRWEPPSRVGIYLGRSPQHAASIGLILNFQSGHVSPQYHCVYDNLFWDLQAWSPPYLNQVARTSPFWLCGINVSTKRCILPKLCPIFHRKSGRQGSPRAKLPHLPPETKVESSKTAHATTSS